jgi:predicted SAM-dependent methyltransferase
MPISPVQKATLAASHGLNVGSGRHYADGWVNIDVLPEEGQRPPDFAIGVEEMDAHFPDRVFEKAYLGHVLEHLPWDGVVSGLRHVARKVVEGGTIMVVGPCIRKVFETRQPIEMVDAIVSDPRHARQPWGHQWTPTEELVLWAMNEAGLDCVTAWPVEKVKAPGWPNPSAASWQMAAYGYAR